MTTLKINEFQKRIRSVLSDESFLFVQHLLACNASVEVYLVGGAVRDLLLGRDTKDYDFVVRNLSLPKMEKLLRQFGEVNIVGKRFGVLKFVPHSKKKNRGAFEPFDIALPRLEFSIGETGHYRDFQVTTDYQLEITSDLSRRDFTINAICWDVRNEKIVDPFNGMADIQKKVIRAVGNPDLRFREDYSRMLRALRFSCSLGFAIESKTFDALQKKISSINKKIRPTTLLMKKKKDENVLRVVPYEVIAREMIRTFKADPIPACDYYDSLRLFDLLIPEMKPMRSCPQDPRWHSEGDVWTHSRLCLEQLVGARFKKEFNGEVPDATLIFTALFHDIGKAYTIQTPEKNHVDRIRFHGHDRVGAEIAQKCFERLRMLSVEKDPVDPSVVAWLIKNHLILLNSDIKTLKHTTLEKYFFRIPSLGRTLLKLIYVDSLASVRADGKTSLGNYRQCKKRLAEFLRTAGAQKEMLPKPIISGDDVMNTLRIAPGPQVGETLMRVREEQLAGRVKTKKDAIIFLKKIKIKK
ncbi:CCA tRNA nucleotidyltransferase [Candidatus Uhrbacteria bacterium]|nr:CCA tRNA nucleotidyltransferase [Candidatus Uhrbacteria bacterium]